MAKAKLTTRAISTTTVTSDNLAKASQLTHNQLDSNFLNLRDATFGVVADDSATIQIGMDSNLYIRGGDNVTTSTDSAGVVTINATGGDSLGDLTAVGSTISSPSNAAITLDPSGTGTIELNADTNVTGNLTTSGNLIVDGLSIGTGEISPAGTYISGTRSNENIVIDPNGSGEVKTASDFHVTGNITATENINNDAITIADNKIYTTRTNEDLELDCAGSGELRVLCPSTQIGNSTIHGSFTVYSSGQSIGFFPTGDGNVNIDHFQIRQNTMTTVYSNDNFELNANGSGIIHLIPGLKVGSGATVTTILDEDAMGTDSATALATQQSIKKYVDDNTGIGDLSIVGSTISSPSNADLTLLTSGSGDIVLNQITIADNTITTNSSNANLYIDASGTGDVYIEAGDDVYLKPADDVKIQPGDDIHLVTNGSNNNLIFWNNNGSALDFYGNYAAVWNIYKADDAVDHWAESGTNDLPGTGADLWTVNVSGGTGSGVYDAGAGGKLLFEAGADWSGSSRSTTFEIQLAQTGSTSLTTPFKINATGNVDLTGGLTAGTSIENDAIRITDNTILGLRSNDNITITPAGTGSVAIAKAAITGGTVTGITDITVADGGTGASSLTDGGVLLGSGTGAITAMAVLSDGEMIVGDGSTDPVAESGATLRTSIGVGTGDSPQFTGLTISGSSALDQVTVTDNTISSNASNANLEINANGSGTVVLENLSVAGDGATVTGILDEDAMGSDSAVKLATQQSIKAYVDSKSHLSLIDEDDMSTDSATRPPSQQSVKAYADTKAVLTGSTNNTLTTVTGAHAFQGEANATFDGSTLAITGAITATTNISTDAIQLVDNKISASRSNDTMYLQPAGTGRVVIGNADWFDDFGSLISGAYGSVSRLKGNCMYYVDEAIVPGADRTYANWIQTSLKTDGSDTTSSNARFRNICEMGLDLNGSSITHSSLSRGAQAVNCTAYITSSSTDDSIISSTSGFIGYVYLSPLANGNVTITNGIGVRGSCDVDVSNLGAGKTGLITNAYGFFYPGNQAYGTGSGGTATITNSYGFYAESDNAQGANNWAFYDDRAVGNNSDSRLGTIQLFRQNSAPSTVADAAHIYALDDSASAEVYVKDEAGNATKISPHNEKGEWEYYSKNSKTGKTVRVNMEKMIRKLEEFTGESFIETI